MIVHETWPTQGDGREGSILHCKGAAIGAGTMRAAAAILAVVLILSAAIPARLDAQADCKLVMGQTPCISCCNGCCEGWQ